MINKNVNIY